VQAGPRLKFKSSVATLLALAIFVGQPGFGRSLTATEYNESLKCGINLGNALDAPKEGDWGVVLQSDYFKLIKTAGFNHVRLPVRWSSHASN